jgi:2,4-dichlorophenol 6-monooxygenase
VEEILSGTSIAGEDGKAWLDAAQSIAGRRAIPLTALRIGLRDGDYIDIRGAWAKVRSIDRTGVLLVRPDRYVGFRSSTVTKYPLRTLEAVFDAILCV